MEEAEKMVESDNDTTEKNKKVDFRLDVTAIEKIDKDNQATELQSLNLDVYDTSTFEKGFIAQVEEAIKVKNPEIEEGEISEDDEVSAKVKRGEMTPFGQSVGSNNTENTPSRPNANTISELERYLQSQAKLQKNKQLKCPKKIPTLVLREKTQPKEYKIGAKVPKKKLDSPKKRKSNEKFLGPKKKKKKEKLGTKILSKTQEKPNLQPGEIDMMDLSDSDISYEPSSSSEYECDEKPKPKRKKRKIRSFSDLSTDDSGWEDSSDENQKVTKKKYHLDDGDLDLYEKRISNIDSTEFTEFHIIDNETGFKCPQIIWDKLFVYQRVGVSWFWQLNKERCGGILGDEMGLGKTIQTIAFLASLYVSDIHDFDTGCKGLGPTLIICPTTVMHQWVREFHTWLPQVRIALLHDSGTFTGKQRNNLINSIVNKNQGVLITSYTSLVNNRDQLVSRSWHYVILDEGHKIRNENAQVTKVAKQLLTPHRLILSGSPLQNNLKELWTLFDFIFPGKLGSLPIFLNVFQAPIVQGTYTNATPLQVQTGCRVAKMLKDTINPYLLRRMKIDVNSHIDLPPKTEQVLFCKLSKNQVDMYKHFLETIDYEMMARGREKLFVGLLSMRKICNHPDLYSGGPTRSFKIDKQDTKPESFGYWERAGKMIVINTLLQIWHQQKHRVLIFTQSSKMLLILEKFVKSQDYNYLKLDGETAITSRQVMIDKFNEDEKIFVMLLTTKVGGLGVNLTGANRVVIYDPDWNPATDSQARERAWRIGQKKDVTIYRLITAGTIEEKMYHRQIFKQFLTNKVLNDPRQRRFFKANDLIELFTLTETMKNGTNETAAIFAGTGSEVKIPKKVKKSKKIKVDVPEIHFSKEKVEEMQQRAKALSDLLKKSLETKNNDCLAIPSTSKECLNNKNKNEKTKKKCDKKKKKKKSIKFEGNNIPYLVKHEKVTDKEPVQPMSQDDYVLQKLFTRTGIETALKHDKIMGVGPSDYAIIEAEADKVAKDAIKTLKESRLETRPVKKSVGFRSNPGTSSLNLLSRLIDQDALRNVTITDKHLLESIIDWLCSNGGTSSTDQVINEFKNKIDEGKSPLFKSLLSKIATFYRGPDDVGYWSIKDDFK